MSENLETTYNPKAIESKLYEKWCEKKYFHAEVDRDKKPFTIVMPHGLFPAPTEHCSPAFSYNGSVKRRRNR